MGEFNPNKPPLQIDMISGQSCHISGSRILFPNKKIFIRFDTARGKIFIGGEINGVFAAAKTIRVIWARATPCGCSGEGVIGVLGW